MKRHINIPIFIPHLGCPNQCVFCNQRTISGKTKFEIENVRAQIEEGLSTVDDSTEVEIAFFGGSFTGIDRNLMISLLSIAYEYIKTDRVNSIRCSTRPDYIDNEVLAILKEYGVSTIELGLQSVSDNVLEISKRGHTRLDEQYACKMIVDSGFNLVGQMMIGLPGATVDDEIETARFIISSGASGARIYPTVVFYGTELCEMAQAGEYSPISLSEAIERSAKVLELFIDSHIKVIRIGLCSSENLVDSEKYYAGPNHPAIGEMVVSAMIYNKIVLLLGDNNLYKGKMMRISVPKGCLSKAIGQNKCNINKLILKYQLADLKISEDESLSGYELKIEEERKRECT